MASKTIDIELNGYRRDKNKSGLPVISGIYCVYTCTPVKNTNLVTVQELVYIGEAKNINTRINDGHEKYDDWLTHVKSGSELCFSYAAVSSADRKRAEAALIFKHKPPENTEYKNSFPFDNTTISLSGKTAKLTAKFTVDRTE